MSNTDQKRFDYGLARSRTSETSILAISTIAATASLVLFGLYVQAQIETVDSNQDVQSKKLTVFNNYKFGIQIMGLLFASLGFAYREVTARTIDKTDEDWLKEQTCLSTEPNNKLNRTYDRLRETIIRILLFLPIVAWSYLILFSPYWVIAAGFVIVSLVIVSIYCFMVYFSIIPLEYTLY